MAFTYDPNFAPPELLPEWSIHVPFRLGGSCNDRNLAVQV